MKNPFRKPEPEPCNSSLIADNPRTEDTFVMRCERETGHKGTHSATTDTKTLGSVKAQWTR